MNPRRRKHGNRALPRNLYRTPSGGYRYRNPETRKFIALPELSEADAIRVATELNQELMQHDFIINGMAFNRVADEFFKWICTQGNSARTLAEKEIKIRRYKNAWGNRGIRGVSRQIIREWLDEHITQHDAYRQHKILLNQLFKYAVSRGYADTNPAEGLLVMPAKQPKKRRRLTLDEFKLLHSHAEPWMQIAMELSLLTGLRLSNVCNAKLADVVDGELRCVTKNGHHQAYRGLTGLIARAIELPPASPWIVSGVFKGRRTTETYVKPDYLTRAFTKLCREHLEGDDLPTFHEIRSLTSDLYRRAGWDQESIKDLMGHEDIEMTEHYQEGHGDKWTRVVVGLEWQA